MIVLNIENEYVLTADCMPCRLLDSNKGDNDTDTVSGCRLVIHVGQGLIGRASGSAVLHTGSY